MRTTEAGPKSASESPQRQIWYCSVHPIKDTEKEYTGQSERVAQVRRVCRVPGAGRSGFIYHIPCGPQAGQQEPQVGLTQSAPRDCNQERYSQR